MSRTGKSMEAESRPVVAAGAGQGRRGVSINRYGVSSGNAANVLKLDSGDGGTTL